MLLGLIAVVVGLLLADLLLFARGREPTFRESVVWSVGWLVLGVAVALPLIALDSPEGAVNYLTVYLIERSLSLDNLFVFLLIFAYFKVPHEVRSILLFWGIALALVMRGLAIVVGVELIERFHFVLYLLGALLLYLAWRVLRGVDDDIDPGRGLFVRAVRRVYPVSDHFDGAHFFTRVRRRRAATPLLLDEVVHAGPVVSLALVLVSFAVGITASVIADRRDPQGAEARRARL